MAEPKDKPAPSADEAEFQKSELIDVALAEFGVSPEILAGALHEEERLTKKRARRLLNEFLNREVK